MTEYRKLHLFQKLNVDNQSSSCVNYFISWEVAHGTRQIRDWKAPEMLCGTVVLLSLKLN